MSNQHRPPQDNAVIAYGMPQLDEMPQYPTPEDLLTTTTGICIDHDAEVRQTLDKLVDLLIEAAGKDEITKDYFVKMLRIVREAQELVKC